MKLLKKQLKIEKIDKEDIMKCTHFDLEKECTTFDSSRVYDVCKGCVIVTLFKKKIELLEQHIRILNRIVIK